MSKTEIYDGEISVEGLRKFFQEKNDFTSMPTWDVGKLDEDQAEFREWIFGYLNKSWDDRETEKVAQFQFLTSKKKSELKSSEMRHCPAGAKQE